jgi:hypothetical protein
VASILAFVILYNPFPKVRTRSALIILVEPSEIVLASVSAHVTILDVLPRVGARQALACGQVIQLIMLTLRHAVTLHILLVLLVAQALLSKDTPVLISLTVCAESGQTAQG